MTRSQQVKYLHKHGWEWRYRSVTSADTNGRDVFRILAINRWVHPMVDTALTRDEAVQATKRYVHRLALVHAHHNKLFNVNG
jgi:hypothetical protein